MPTGLDDVTTLGAGFSQFCANRRSGGVYCWGTHSAGELGTGAGGDGRIPLRAIGIDDAIVVEGGNDFTCAIDRTGVPYCWGTSSGLLNDGVTGASAPAPVTLP